MGSAAPFSSGRPTLTSYLTQQGGWVVVVRGWMLSLQCGLRPWAEPMPHNTIEAAAAPTASTLHPQPPRALLPPPRAGLHPHMVILMQALQTATKIIAAEIAVGGAELGGALNGSSSGGWVGGAAHEGGLPLCWGVRALCGSLLGCPPLLSLPGVHLVPRAAYSALAQGLRTSLAVRPAGRRR